jgi:hypothetical protein
MVVKGFPRGWRRGTAAREQRRLGVMELSAAAAGHKLIFKMSSEHQTVDHTNELMDHDTVCVIRTACSTTMALGPGLIHHIIHHKR